MKKEISDPEKAIRYDFLEERREKTRKLAAGFVYGVSLMLALIALLAGINNNVGGAMALFIGEGILVALLVDWGVIAAILKEVLK